MDVPLLGGPSSSLNKDVGPQIRLLVCAQCKTVDELPDYAGDPRGDTLLQVSIERNHTDPVTQQTHVGNLIKVPLKHWADSRTQAEILKQIREGSGGVSEVDEKFYTARSTFFDDAMACFKKHLRPKGRCPDWKADNKRLIPDTAKDRKELGLAKVSETGPKVYLCQFCPVNTYMVTRARNEAGMYDE